MIKFQFNSFIAGKAGASFEECEDALAVDLNAGRCAIADGATEAFAAGSWARALVANWVKNPRLSEDAAASDFARWAEAVASGWAAEWHAREMSWYAATKRDAGSFAAFVGVEFEELDNELKWRTLAIGDSCLIHARNSEILCAMPLDAANKFNSTPRLLASRHDLQADVAAQVNIKIGVLKAGEALWLLTDAIAAWWLSGAAESSRESISRIAEFERLIVAEDKGKIQTLICDERLCGRLRDDDVAALRITV